MNSTTKLLILCLVLVAGWIGVQQLRPARPAVTDTSCSLPGGG